MHLDSTNKKGMTSNSMRRGCIRTCRPVSFGLPETDGILRTNRVKKKCKNIDMRTTCLSLEGYRSEAKVVSICIACRRGSCRERGP